MELATEQAEAAIEPPVVETPPPVVEDAAEMSADGNVPDVAELVPDEVQAENPAKQPFNMDAGVHYIEEYQAECEATGNADKWQDKYAQGHTQATQFVQPYDGRYANTFALRKGQSASEGVEDFLKGLTISDYRAIGVAQEIDEVRDEMGDRKFDRLFGSKSSDEDSTIPIEQRLTISSAAYTTPIDEQMREIGEKDDAKQAQQANANDPTAWQSYEREPQQDAEEKKEKADEVVEQSPIAEAREDKTLQ